MTAEDLLPRVGKLLRVNIANPGDPSAPAKEWTARLDRVWPDQQIADFQVGYTTLHVSFSNIISIEGGLQTPVGPNPAQTVEL